jgi:hypothetical protein
LIERTSRGSCSASEGTSTALAAATGYCIEAVDK